MIRLFVLVLELLLLPLSAYAGRNTEYLVLITLDGLDPARFKPQAGAPIRAVLAQRLTR